MKKLAIASALLSALAVTGTANAYQAEVGASAGLIDPDNGSTSGSFGVDGTYYFNPVQTRNAPLAEAAFLDRASNVNAHYNYDELSDTAENHDYGVGLEYYVPNSDFYVGATVGQNKVKYDNFDDFDTTVFPPLGEKLTSFQKNDEKISFQKNDEKRPFQKNEENLPYFDSRSNQ